VDEERLGRLAVVEAALDAAAEGRAHHHGHGVLAAAAVAVLGSLAHQLVEARVDEVGELDLGDGLEAVERHADGGAEDAALVEWRVDDALLAEGLVQPLRDAEDTAHAAHVFAQHHHVRVRRHLLMEPGVDGLHHVHFHHVVPRRCHGVCAYTSFRSVSSAGFGRSSATRRASVTSASTASRSASSAARPARPSRTARAASGRWARAPWPPPPPRRCGRSAGRRSSSGHRGGTSPARATWALRPLPQPRARHAWRGTPPARRCRPPAPRGCRRPRPCRRSRPTRSASRQAG
jgi:hypothetical protein